ncbi:MAG: outer membrane protein assembly factor BamA [Devosiaceae bacterium]|nr:outer membrane protein assembly factor BamA [Devosiaceae bacterium]
MIQRNLLRSFILSLALVLFAPVTGIGFGVFGVEAAQAQTVSRISVTGNSRVDDLTLKSYLTIRVGDVATNSKIQASINSLNSTGLFSSVSVRYSGGTLSVSVRENSIVASVLFEGNQRFSDDKLIVLVNLASRGTFTQERLQGDVAAIQSAYGNAGYTNVSVTSRTEAVEDGRMRIVFVIDEGDRAGIAAINFTGNNSFNSGTLKGVISTRETNLMSWLFNDDELKQEKLDFDKEAIRFYYVNRGFPDAQVLSAVAEFDADRNAYFVSFTISEGERYSFGEIGIETSIPGLDTGALKPSIRTYQGGTYSFRDLQRSVEDLAFRATGQGFAFADVRPRLDRDVANKIFNVTYLIDEGARVYVERINITGNTKTRDFVIRRELDFAEGDPFNRSMVTRGKTAIEQLNYFASVGVTTQSGSAADKIILNIAVVEKSTGDYGFSAGYSSSDGVLGEISLTETNFLGRGQYLKISVGATPNGQTYELSFSEPRFAGLRVSAGFDLYKSISSETAASFYGSDATGGQLRFGVPLTDELSASVMVGIESRTFVDNAPNDSVLGLDGVTRNKAFIGYSLTYNSVDSPTIPTTGLIATLSQQYVGWDNNFISTEAKARYFIPVIQDSGIVASVRGQVGVISDLSGTGVNVTETYFKGPNLVRGFQARGMGPNAANGESLGSTVFAGISAELEFPIPALPESYGLRGAVWADVGYLSSASIAAPATVSGDTQQVRSSVGASIIWNSPFGPLRGDFAQVLQQDTGDSTQVFQFTISTLL